MDERWHQVAEGDVLLWNGLLVRVKRVTTFAGVKSFSMEAVLGGGGEILSTRGGDPEREVESLD